LANGRELNSTIAEHFVKEYTFGVVGIGANQVGWHAEASEVVGHIGRAARYVGVACHRDHWHWRFRGDPRGIAHDVVVEHDVSDHDDAQLGEFVK